MQPALLKKIAIFMPKLHYTYVGELGELSDENRVGIVYTTIIFGCVYHNEQSPRL